MGLDLYGEPMPLEERLRGMKDCLAYIMREAEAFCLQDVAAHLCAACEQLERDIAASVEHGPIDLATVFNRRRHQ